MATVPQPPQYLYGDRSRFLIGAAAFFTATAAFPPLQTGINRPLFAAPLQSTFQPQPLVFHAPPLSIDQPLLRPTWVARYQESNYQPPPVLFETFIPPLLVMPLRGGGLYARYQESNYQPNALLFHQPPASIDQPQLAPTWLARGQDSKEQPPAVVFQTFIPPLLVMPLRPAIVAKYQESNYQPPALWSQFPPPTAVISPPPLAPTWLARQQDSTAQLPAMFFQFPPPSTDPVPVVPDDVTNTPGRTIGRRVGLPGQVRHVETDAEKRERRIAEGTIPAPVVEPTPQPIALAASSEKHEKALAKLLTEKAALQKAIAKLETKNTAKAQKDLAAKQQAMQMAMVKEALVREQIEVIEVAAVALAAYRLSQL